jgi:acyl carrier protein
MAASKKEIIELMCNTLTVSKDELKENLTLMESIGVDSTEIVELIVALEKAFNVVIEPGEIKTNSTPLDIVALIKSKQ